MNYWRTVLPRIKKVLAPNGKKKEAAAEATKAFDASKESIEKEIKKKQEDLAPKVAEIFKSLDINAKKAVKEPTPAAIKKNAGAIQKFLEELSKIGFPGASEVSEGVTKYGLTLITGPVTFELQQVSPFIPEEEPPKVEEEVKEVVTGTDREVEVAPAETTPSKADKGSEDTQINSAQKIGTDEVPKETVSEEKASIPASENKKTGATEVSKGTETLTEPAKDAERTTKP